jgi:hypothetical protein
MSKIQFSFPRLFYLKSHRNERGGYIYADDLFNQHEWKTQLRDFDTFIQSYINSRQATAEVDDSLRTVSLSGQNRRGAMETYQTMVGELINHYVHVLVGTVIINQYEHFKPPISGSQKKVSLGSIDQLVRTVAELASDVSNTRSMLNSNIRNVVSPMKIEFHDKYLRGEEESENFLVSRNPNLSSFQVLPEMLGVDVAGISASSGSAERYPLEFTSASLVGWEYSSPQERTMGCSGDLASILTDIIWLVMKKDFGAADEFTQTTGQNAKTHQTANIKYLFQKIAPFYNTLVTSNLIGALSSHNEDFGDTSGVNGSIDNQNPMVIGVKDNRSRVPETYGLWCIYRAVRTPFYNRLAVETSTVGLSVESFFPFNVTVNASNQLALISRSTAESKDSIKSIKDVVMKNFREATKLTGHTTVSNFEAAVTEEKEVKITNLAAKSLERLYNKLDRASDNFWRNLISSALANIGTNLLVASQIDWKKAAENLGESGLFGSLQEKVTFRSSGEGTNVDVSEQRTDFTVQAASAYINLQGLLRGTFGTSLGTAMGGTSLQGNDEISVQRFNEQVVYPGDASVMESLSSYLDLLNSDLNTVGSQLQVGLENMSQKYWTRDVRKWLEVIFQTFQFHSTPSRVGDQQTRFKFSSMERIVKLIYTKQISVMRDFLQKINALERRIKQGKGAPDPAIERQMAMTSLFATSAICYMKRQIAIIFYLLTKVQSSKFVAGVESKYPVASYQSANRNLQVTVRAWFKSQLSELMKGVTNPQIAKTIQSFSKDLCGDAQIESGVTTSTTISQQHLRDEETNKIISDPRFWLLAMTGLKGLDPSTVAKDPAKLKKLFIPVYEQLGNGTRRYWLFDLIPFIVKGTFSGTFGGKSPPQWYNSEELVKSKSFTQQDNAYVIICNNSDQLVNNDKWRAINVEWFTNLIKQANAFASKTGNPSRKMWVIRFSVYLLMHDTVIYSQVTGGKTGVTCCTNDVVKINVPGVGEQGRMKVTLEQLQQMTDSDKRNRGLFVNLISREMFGTDLSNAKLLFKSL